MFRYKDEIKKLLRDSPELRKEIMGIRKYHQRLQAERGIPRYGIVSDNKDPLCLGRVRVASDIVAPGYISPWIPVVALGATKNSGWWQLPDKIHRY